MTNYAKGWVGQVFHSYFQFKSREAAYFIKQTTPFDCPRSLILLSFSVVGSLICGTPIFTVLHVSAFLPAVLVYQLLLPWKQQLSLDHTPYLLQLLLPWNSYCCIRGYMSRVSHYSLVSLSICTKILIFVRPFVQIFTEQKEIHP